jgi:PRTRC genetic system protein C
MSLIVNGMERSFSFQKGNDIVVLSDPNPADTPEAVMSYYSNIYPELTTASVHGPEIKENKAVYEFKTTIGTKG